MQEELAWSQSICPCLLAGAQALLCPSPPVLAPSGLPEKA